MEYSEIQSKNKEELLKIAEELKLQTYPADLDVPDLFE